MAVPLLTVLRQIASRKPLAKAASLSYADFSRHDELDARRLSALQRAIADGDAGRARMLIGELIVGWRPIAEGRMVLRHGRDVTDEAISRLEEKLVRLLLDDQQFDQPWGQVYWRNADWVVRDVLRERRKAAARLAELDDLAAAAADPEAENAFDELEARLDVDAARLHRALAKLSDSDRQLFEMLYLRDMKPSETAAALGIKTGALAVRKHRAIEHLTAAFFAADVIDPLRHRG